MSGNKTIGRLPSGVITPPPSKSLIHRALICAALAGGRSEIENFRGSDDVDATLEGVRKLRPIKTSLDGDVMSLSPAPGAPRQLGPRGVIDCGESGSTLRFLLPIVALDKRPTIFAGRGRLLHRPLDVYADVFASSGALFEQDGDRALARGPLRSGEFRLPGNVSSQFVSGLLLALPLLDGDSVIRLSTPLESRRYVDMTIDVMRRFGVGIDSETDTLYRVRGGQRYHPARIRIEADYSQAAFFLVSAALGRDVMVAGLSPNSVQGDREILDVLSGAGADVKWDDGIVSVRAKRLSAITFDAREAPDLVPPIAVLCCFCEGESRITNAGRLRIKESDRLSALSSELKKLGARIEETEDSLAITGMGSLRGGGVDAWSDHRIAMAMAVAAVRCDTPVSLSGWRNVSKSYPDFWRDFEGGAR